MRTSSLSFIDFKNIIARLIWFVVKINHWGPAWTRSGDLSNLLRLISGAFALLCEWPCGINICFLVAINIIGGPAISFARVIRVVERLSTIAISGKRSKTRDGGHQSVGLSEQVIHIEHFPLLVICATPLIQLVL